MSPTKVTRPEPARTLPGSPFLVRVGMRSERMVAGTHPFTLPWMTAALTARDTELRFRALAMRGNPNRGLALLDELATGEASARATRGRKPSRTK